MHLESHEHQFRAFRVFLDSLYGVLIGFLIARLHDFQFFGLVDGGWPALERVLPFVVLYFVYLLKLTLFWLGSRNSLKILSYYVAYSFRGYHYLGTILSALVITQVVSSTVCNCGSIERQTLTAFTIYFLAWMTIGTVVGDAIPTLAGVLPMVRSLIEAAEEKATNKKRRRELESIRDHYEGPIRLNGYINLTIVALSWGAYVLLWSLGISPLSRLYSLVGLLVVLNVFQELHLWVARESQLRMTLDDLADLP
jgi:hypothetical protein